MDFVDKAEDERMGMLKLGMMRSKEEGMAEIQAGA